MTDEIYESILRKARYDADFYTDNRISRRSASGARNGRRYGAFDDRHSRRNEDNSDRVAKRGKRKVGETRREAGQRKRFIERRRGLLLAIACVIFFIAVVALIYKLVFVVRNINVTGSERYSGEEIVVGSGISEGMNLYSFKGSSVANRITLACPYISSVSLDREIPNTVNIEAKEDEARYYTEIYGEIKLISTSLRVLETVDETSIPEGVIKLKLPKVSYSVAGRELLFESEKHKFEITQILKYINESALNEKLTVIDLRDRYNLTMVSEGKHKLILGVAEDVDYKLRVASAVLKDEMFATDNKFRIDLTVRGKTGVVMDNLLDAN